MSRSNIQLKCNFPSTNSYVRQTFSLCRQIQLPPSLMLFYVMYNLSNKNKHTNPISLIVNYKWTKLLSARFSFTHIVSLSCQMVCFTEWFVSQIHLERSCQKTYETDRHLQTYLEGDWTNNLCITIYHRLISSNQSNSRRALPRVKPVGEINSHHSQLGEE